MSNPRWSITIASPGPLDVDEFSTQSKEKLVIVPNFYGKGDQANMAVVKVLDGAGKVLSTAILTVSGINGKIRVKDVSSPVLPASEQPKAPAKVADAKPAAH